MKKKVFRLFSVFLVVLLLIPMLTTTVLAAATISQSDGSSLPDIVYVGEKYRLRVKNRNVTFYSVQPTIATVTEAGTLRPVKPGSVMIYARDKDGKRIAEKRLTVNQRATAVTANVETLYLEPGEVYTLKPTLTPSTSTDVVRFGSDDRSIASVGSTTGKVTAKALGETTITIYAKRTASTSNTNSTNLTTTVRVVVREKPLTAEIVGENQIKATFFENVPGVTAENFSVMQANDSGVSRVLGIESAVQYSSNEYLLTLTEPVFSTVETSSAALYFYSPDEESYSSAYINLGENVVYSPILANAIISGNEKIEEGTSGFLQFFGVDQDGNPHPLENVTVNLQSYVDTSNRITLPETGAVMDNVSFSYKQLSDGSIVVTYAAPPGTVAEGANAARVAVRLMREDGSSLFITPLSVTRAKEGEKYNLNFVSDDGETLFDTLTVRAGTTYETPTPSREGYTFKGWLRSDGAEGNVMPEQDLTLTAVWEEGGESPVPSTPTTMTVTVYAESYTYGSPVTPTLVDGPTDALAVTYQYKTAEANELAWSDAVPTDAGDYQVRAVIAVTENYTVMTAAADFTIWKREVTITGTAVEPSKVYDGDNSAVIINDGTIDGVVEGDDLTIIPGTAAYDDETVGEGKTVTFSDFELTGADKDNYVLAAQPDPVTADITDPNAENISVDISWDSMDFTYTAPGKGTWNPKTHQYENATAGGWTSEGGNITVTNNGNVGVIASFSFAQAEGMDEIRGAFTASLLAVDVEKADTTTLTLSGTPSAAFEDKELGTVSVGISKYGLISQDGKTYYYDDTGVMCTGWRNDIPGWEGKWIFFDDNGVMRTGWESNIPGWEGQWFYFGDDGAMRTGWVELDGMWYYFDESGQFVKSSTEAPSAG